MADKNVGALLVTREGKIIGMMTERDYSRKVALANRSSTSTKVSEIMSSSVLYVEPDDSVEAALSLMTAERIRHLPVIESGRLVGLVSIGDLVRTAIDDREFLINQLTVQLTGAYTNSPTWVETYEPLASKLLTPEMQ